MTTLEPLSEAELNELQARWLAGDRERRLYRGIRQTTDDDADIGSPAWIKRESAPLPEFTKYGPDPLAEDWTRHTVDINANPMSVEDDPIAYVKPWKWLAALAVVAVFYVAVWVLVVWVARR